MLDIFCDVTTKKTMSLPVTTVIGKGEKMMVLTIRFVENLEKLTLCKAFSLVWVHEIHIDAKYQDDFRLPDLIEHETKHHIFLWRRFHTKNKLKRVLWIFYNNSWDQVDVLRLEIKWFWKGITKCRGTETLAKSKHP